MNSMPVVSVYTLGCKLNQAESESLAARFEDMGCRLSSGNVADIFLLNTCSVTHIADRKSRRLVRMLRSLNPQALIAVTGCYAERDGNALRQCGADVVVGNRDKMSVPEMIESRLKSMRAQDIAIRTPGRVRSFIKIQDGCRNFCSYCIVPYLRRDVFSIPADRVINEIGNRVACGYKEAVLTGTEIGSYNDGDCGLTELLKRILKETGIERLHLSSLQPQEIDEGLLSLWETPRLVRHFHIAVQSGSDLVLKWMRRRYDKERYKDAVDLIRELVPGASVTTDIMVGFPGETEIEFRESYNFCSAMKFSAMHVFSYSPRPGTHAASMPGRVSEKIKKERSLLMLALAARSTESFAAGFIGQSMPVLWEKEVKADSGIYLGLTDNYLRVYAASKYGITNTILNARLLGPADCSANRILRSCTRGNAGELWS
ncbi:MAG: tRNA (N(6)-L-threonylcarbamoyladenosine(37)-C(2))-methylthiotransferase MtaB, partial [Dehalococcoidia bacterium]|nr:tRNA (N(6)-L-threonylcarbamoyladenosine(37)-C(2))-methylthiotransferase MtaB [Dehalococcoidia bacterium]